MGVNIDKYDPTIRLLLNYWLWYSDFVKRYVQSWSQLGLLILKTLEMDVPLSLWPLFWDALLLVFVGI
jgi:hypothetical protein